MSPITKVNTNDDKELLYLLAHDTINSFVCLIILCFTTVVTEGVDLDPTNKMAALPNSLPGHSLDEGTSPRLRRLGRRSRRRWS